MKTRTFWNFNNSWCVFQRQRPMPPSSWVNSGKTAVKKIPNSMGKHQKCHFACQVVFILVAELMFILQPFNDQHRSTLFGFQCLFVDHFASQMVIGWNFLSLIDSLPIFCQLEIEICFCFKSTSNRKEQEVMCITNFSTDTVDTDHPQFFFGSLISHRCTSCGFLAMVMPKTIWED